MDNKELRKDNLYLDEFKAYLISIDMADSSIKTYIQNIMSFVKWFKETNEISFEPDKVTEIDIRDMRSYLQNIKKLKESTINLRLTSLKIYFSYLELYGYIKSNPAKMIKKIRVVSQDISKSIDDSTYHALRREIYRCSNTKHISMFELLSLGLRNSELINLKISDLLISEKKGTLKVTGKGNKIRYIPMTNDSRLAVINWLELRKKIKTNFDNLFISERRVPYTRSAVWKIIRKYSKRIGVEDITVHSLRHWFCRTLLKRGVDISIVAKLAGHSSGYTTAKIYTIPKSQQELEDAIKKL